MSGSSALSYAQIANANVSSSAAIAYSKLSLSGSILGSDISTSAAVPYSKLSLTGSVVNADIGSSAGIAYSKLSLAGSILNSDINSSAGIAGSKISPNFGSQNVITTGNIAVGSGSYGSGSGVISIANAITNPSTNPSGGLVAYVDALDGYFKTRTASGQVIALNGASTGGGGFTPPTGTGLAHITSGALDTAAHLLVDADVSSSAAIQGTKISPNFGSQNIITSASGEFDGYARLGTGNLAQSGLLRFPTGASTAFITIRNNANTSDLSIISGNGTDTFAFGTANSNSQISGATTSLIANSTTVFTSGGTKNTMGVPLELGGGTYASAGTIRLQNNLGSVIAQRNSGNSADLTFLALGTTDGYLGSDTSKSTNLTNIHIAPSTQTDIYAGSTQIAAFTSGLVYAPGNIRADGYIGSGSGPYPTSGLFRAGGNSGTETLLTYVDSGGTTRTALNVASNVLNLGTPSTTTYVNGVNTYILSSSTTNAYFDGSNTWLGVNGTYGIKLSSALANMNLPMTIGTSGSTFAASGLQRYVNNPGVIMAQRNSGNTADIVLLSADTSNLGLLGTVSAGSGSGVLSISNATTNPSTNPSGGLVAYVDNTDGYFKTRTRDGYVVALNGASSSVQSILKTEIWTSGGTTTAPSTSTYAIISGLGGGGGGGSGSTSGSPYGCGGGGGGATQMMTVIVPVTGGGTSTVTIGAGGSGGASVSGNSKTGNAGGNGGYTSVWGVVFQGAQGGAGGLIASTASSIGGSSNAGIPNQSVLTSFPYQLPAPGMGGLGAPAGGNGGTGYPNSVNTNSSTTIYGASGGTAGSNGGGGDLTPNLGPTIPALLTSLICS